MGVLYGDPEQGNIITQKACDRRDIQGQVTYSRIRLRYIQKLIITAQITPIFSSVISTLKPIQKSLVKI